jgi:threonine 3-dehydrogenase
MGKMKSIAKLKPEEGLWMRDESIPEPGPNDILIKVNKTAICGTDVHIYNWDKWSRQTIPVPMTVGHEFAGTAYKVGKEVLGIKEGDRLSCEGHLTCGHCRNCRAGKRHLCRNTKGIGVNVPGCFAEYICVPASNIFKIPDSISDEMASIMDPMGNATHTALSFDLVGEDVLITGAGPIGIMAVAIAKHVGARHVVITDVNEYRLDLAKKMGATRAVNVSSESLSNVVKDLGMLEGFDVGMEMSGNPQAFRDMIGLMNHGGKISILGIPEGAISLEMHDIIFKGLILKGIYGREMFETWYKMKSMLQSDLSMDDVITHRFSVDDFKKGFDIMRSGKSGKVILEWN